MGLSATSISKHLDKKTLISVAWLPVIQSPSIKSMKNNIIKNKTRNSQKSRTIIFCVINSFTNYLKNIVPLPLLSLSFSSFPSLTFLNNLVQKAFGWTKQDRHPHSGREVTAAWHRGLEPKREGYGICATKCSRRRREKRTSIQEVILEWGGRA